MDTLDWAIETQTNRNKLARLATAAETIRERAEEHRKSLDHATKSETDYLEGLVDGYEICYNLIKEILEGEKNA
jgi:hypothetical protein